MEDARSTRSGFDDLREGVRNSGNDTHESQRGSSIVSMLADDIGPRPAGSKAESRAADAVVQAFRDAGAEAIHLEVSAPLIGSWSELVASVGGLTALLAALLVPWAGAAIALALAATHTLDGFHSRWMRRLVPKRRSCNVLAIVPATEAVDRRLVLTAALDSPPSGFLGSPRLMQVGERLRACVAGTLASAALLVLFLASADGGRARLLLALPAVALVALLVLVAEREWRESFSPGAISNASSVAALVQTAACVIRNPPARVELWFLALGSSEAGQAGMRQMLDENRFDADMTAFLHLEGIGGGPLHYAVTEGAVRPFHASPWLARLASMTFSAGPNAGPRPLSRLWLDTAAGVALARGFQALTLVGSDARGHVALRGSGRDQARDVDVSRVDGATRGVQRLVDRLDADALERLRLAELADRGE